MTGELGEGGARPGDTRPRPALQRFDFAPPGRHRAGGRRRLVRGQRRRHPAGGQRRRQPDRDARPTARPTPTTPTTGSSVDASRARFLADPAALWRHAFAEAGADRPARLLGRRTWPASTGTPSLAQYRPLLDQVASAAEFADVLCGDARRARHLARLRHGPRRGGGGAGSTAVGLLGADLERGRRRQLAGPPGRAGRVVRPAGPLAAGRAGRPGPARATGCWPSTAAPVGRRRPRPAAGGRRRASRSSSPWPGPAHRRQPGAVRGACRWPASAGCATRTGWPAAGRWSASAATAGSATCTCPTWSARAGPTSTATCAPR